MAEVTKLTFYESYWEAAMLLPETERLAFYDGLFAYAFEGAEPTFEGSPLLAFTLVKPNVDSSIKRSLTNTNNAKKATAKATAETTVSIEGDRDRDRELDGDTDENFSKEKNSQSVNASDGAVSGKPAPSAAPHCPLCDVPVWFNPQTGKFDCTTCHDSFEREAVVWR